MSDSEEETPKPNPTIPSIAVKLFESRQISMFGAIDDDLTEKVIVQLLALEEEDPEAPITLMMNSPGGSVVHGFALYDTIRFVRPKVRIVCLGIAASAATVVLLAADKEDRLSMPNTKFLIHQVYIPGVVRGPASDLEITAKDLLATRERLNQMYVEETGQPMERIAEDTNRDYWMTAQAALEYGLIHRIVRDRGEV